MSNYPCINLTYTSPHEDIEKTMGFNPDGSVNIKFTLLSMQNLLKHNLDVISRLIKESDSITDIVPLGYKIVAINVKSNDLTEILFKDNILITQPQILENDTEIPMNELHFSDEDTETNYQRLIMVNNLVNTDDSSYIFNELDTLNVSSSQSQSDSDDIIDDEENRKSIINKYVQLVNENEELDEDLYEELDEELDDDTEENDIDEELGSHC